MTPNPHFQVPNLGARYGRLSLRRDSIQVLKEQLRGWEDLQGRHENGQLKTLWNILHGSTIYNWIFYGHVETPDSNHLDKRLDLDMPLDIKIHIPKLIL